jgi:putative iron-dependent peroxidase
VKPSNSHSSLTTLEENGKEIKILRDNMPFGRPGSGEFGTFFIGYARSPAPIEQMLENMFVGKPPGNYDRLLDFSTAVTGGLFFVPSASLLEELADREPVAAATESPVIKTLIDAQPINTAVLDATASSPSNASAAPVAGSLNIGSLKGVSQA